MKINQLVSTVLATAVDGAGLATAPASTALVTSLGSTAHAATSAKSRAYTVSIKTNKPKLNSGGSW